MVKGFKGLEECFVLILTDNREFLKVLEQRSRIMRSVVEEN